MLWNYTVTISDTAPVTGPGSPEMGRIWIKPSVSQAYIYLGVEWIPFASGNPITSYTDGIAYLEVAIQETEPTKAIGQIWIKESINVAYIYIDDWFQFLGV